MDSRKPLTAGEIQNPKVFCFPVMVRDDAGIHEGQESFVRASDYARLLSMLTPPTDAAVREAVEEISQELALPPCWCEGSGADELDGTGPCFFEVGERHLRILLRAVQAPRLTVEQREALKIAETLLTDTMSDYGDCEHDVGHCICKYHSGVFNLRAAFPELAGEV